VEPLVRVPSAKIVSPLLRPPRFAAGPREPTILIAILALVGVAYWLGVFLVDHDATRGHIIGSDGLFYYEYLPSVFLDGDLDFSNQRAQLQAEGVPYSWDFATTRTGLPGTPFTAGWAFVTAPFFLLALTIDKVFGLGIAESEHGYGVFYESITNFGAVLAGLVGCWFCFVLCRRESSHGVALIVVLALLGCTALPYYIVVQPSMSHTVGFMGVAGAALFAFAREKTLKDFIWLGVFAGIAFITRPQLAPSLALLYLFVALTDRRPKLLAASGAAALPICAVQLAVWYVLYGKLFTVAQGENFLQLSNPHILQVLFSTRHGLFVWHPLLLIGAVALIFMLIWPPAKDAHTRLILWTCALAALVQINLNASVIDWWAGNSFGNRRFIDVYAFFVVPLAILVQAWWPRRAVIIIAVPLALALWNFLFVVQYRFCYIPRGDDITVNQLILDKFQLHRVERPYCS
jgi:hypothetical protein